MDKIKSSLKKFGLEENEISILIYLLENGISSAVQISKQINIPKTTVKKNIKK